MIYVNGLMTFHTCLSWVPINFVVLIAARLVMPHNGVAMFLLCPLVSLCCLQFGLLGATSLLH